MSETGTIVYLSPEAKDVKNLINLMLKEFNGKNTNDIPIPIKARIVEYEFVSIYPFWDGNGHLSGLFAIYILKAYDHDLKEFYVVE